METGYAPWWPCVLTGQILRVGMWSVVLAFPCQTHLFYYYYYFGQNTAFILCSTITSWL